MVSAVFAAVGLVLSPLVLIVVAWLIFCALTARSRPTDEAVKVIEAAGRWFPLRWRQGQQARGPNVPMEEPHRGDLAA